MTTPNFPPAFLDEIDRAVLARDGRPEGSEIRFQCPAPDHEDVHPSARWSLAKGTWRCDGCGEGGGALDLAGRLGIEKPERQGGGGGAYPSVERATVQSGLTMADLAGAKGLRIKWLRDECGIYEVANYHGGRAVAIPYRGPGGDVIATRYRIALSGDRFRWRRGDKPALYGLWRLDSIRDAGWCLLVEGESDCWTAWEQGLPALGVPGKSVWRDEWQDHLDGLDVVLWQEPDADDFAARVGESIPRLKVIAAPDDLKDLNAAHVAGEDVPALVNQLRETAFAIGDVFDHERGETLRALQAAAAPILAEHDPLMAVEQGLHDLGYGGDVTPALITYLSITTRLLAVRPGTMLAHTLLIGPASAGKSFTVSSVLRLMPESAFAVIDAGSPRVLIYDPEPYQHRALIFAEADSIPAGEDNPAASAIRNLLQDNRLHYKVSVRDPETGGFTVQTIEKPGPTVMITTSTRSLGHQLSTRLFALDVPDDVVQMRAALAAQAATEEDGARLPSDALIAFQSYLQAQAPWDVVVPFARTLGALIGRDHTASRSLRDFQRILSLTKAVAIVRHFRRTRDSGGRLVAHPEDYGYVRELINPMYSATVSGGSKAVRETVQTVRDLVDGGIDSPTALDVANRMEINKSTSTRRINRAIAAGWLINEEDRRNRPYRLKIGDQMPEEVGLPTVEQISGCTVARDTDGNARTPPPTVELTPLRPDTGGAGLRIWTCTRCDLPRSLGPEPCPACGETGGTWIQRGVAA